MKRFLGSNEGYVYILALVSMPLFIGLSLLVIDLSRGNNAHSDLYAAVDAVALAGARELDNGVDSIDRAKVAMSKLTNTVSFLGTKSPDTQIDLVYVDAEDNEFNVIFLDDIPESDDTPITQEFVDLHATTNGIDAQFVYVAAQSRNLRSFFVNPVTWVAGDVPIQAQAVAGYKSAACNVTPLFICNPFEAEGIELTQAFADGQLHGRLIKLHPKGSVTAYPGNFGFLSVNGTSSANAIRNIFAGSYNPTCYDADTVQTKPGAATSISQGINIRFDIYEGPYKNQAGAYSPALNVRKGFLTAATGNPDDACNTELNPELPEDPTQAMGFPDNDVMVVPPFGAAGAFVGSGDWDLGAYWSVNHPTAPLPNYTEVSSFPDAISPGITMPSRYDIYRYEIDQTVDGNDLLDDTSPGGESGLPVCNASIPTAVEPTDAPDRRVGFAAIINCLENDANGASVLPVEAYASIFLVNPMEKIGPDDNTIDVEILDITGGGKGTLDDFLRQESILVR